MASAPSTLQQTETQQENQLVTFCLGNEEFAFDIMSVQEIIRQPPLSRIPMAPDYVDGITNLRGTILPIIDTRSRFGMARQEATDSTRVLVIEVEGVKTGLRVDRVRQVTRIRAGDVEPPPVTIRSGLSSAYLKGLVNLDDGKRIILALSPGAVSKVHRVDPTTVSKESSERNTGHVERGGTARSETVDDQSVSLLVSFNLGEEEFAVPMECVREILRVREPSEVPDSPESLLGVLSVRGNVVPVVDLRTLIGLPKLAVELEESAKQVGRNYEQWLSELARDRVDGGVNPPTAGPECLRAWIGTINTSSDTLMEALCAIRVANEEVIRGCQRLRAMSDDDSWRRHCDREIKPSAERALRGLASLESQFLGSIVDDQRLIVVQVGGELMALVVDKVREVVRVSTSLISAPPRIGRASDNHCMAGMVKLDNGNRLIMLLDIASLLDGRGYDAIRQAAAVAVAGQQNEPATHEKGPSGMMEQRADERQFVVFRLADGEYGIPISEIQEIDRASKTTRIPKSLDCVDGITNLRGEIIPVVNARKRLRLPAREPDERTRVIMIDLRGRKTGLLVDSVREVLNIDRADIVAPPPSVCPDVDPQYIAGIGQVDGGKRTVVLLDVAKIIDAERDDAKTA